MRNLSQIRREVQALQRQLARELAVFRLRRAAEEVSNDYACAVADREDPPQPQEVIRKIADRGFFLNTWLDLHHYLKRVRERGDVPEPRRIVLALLPWAWQSKYENLLTGELPEPEREPWPGLFSLWSRSFCTG